MNISNYPIVNDYIKKLRGIKKSNSFDTRRRLRKEATELLGVMTSKASQVAVEIATTEGLYRA